MRLYYLDDLVAGQHFVGSHRLRIDEDRIKAFAAEFDPQPWTQLPRARRSSGAWPPVAGTQPP